MTHIWMEHAVHGGRAQLPDLPYWRALGWHPCDGPPPEPDLTRDPVTMPDETPELPGSPAVHDDPVMPVEAEEEETHG